MLLGRAPDTLDGFLLSDVGIRGASLDGSLGASKDPVPITFAHPDGAERRLEATVVPASDEFGEPGGVAIWIMDTTDGCATAEKLEAATARIRQSERLERLGTLAGGLAHDFNNLLAPIVGNVELVQLDLPDDSPNQEDLEVARLAALRASDIANRLLHLSRPERDHVEPVRIQDLMSEALALLRSSSGRGIEFVERVDVNCPPVLATKTEIHQVLFNLCKNAVQAMPGGGTLSATVESTEAVATWRSRPPAGESGTLVRVVLTDTGIGMDAKTLERVFEPFFTTKIVGKGSGLGLAMARNIVSTYGGTIEVRSVEGRGSTFALLFPTASDVQHADGHPDAPAPGPKDEDHTPH
jgi:signal transduction histidine kinase